MERHRQKQGIPKVGCIFPTVTNQNMCNEKAYKHHISPTLFYRWWYTVCFGSFADPSIFHAFLSSHPPARFKCYSHLSKESFFKIALVSKSVLAKSNQAVLFLESCLTPGKCWEINFFLYHGKDPTIIHHCLPEIFVVDNKTIKHSLLGQQQQLPNIRSVHITDPQWGFFAFSGLLLVIQTQATLEKHLSLGHQSLL